MNPSRLVPCFILAILAALMPPAAARSLLVYVGTFTDFSQYSPHAPPVGPTTRGIYVFRFDTESGALTPLGLAAEAVNPSFLAFTPSGRFAYAVNELMQCRGRPAGAVTAFAVDRVSGKLAFLNQVSSEGAEPCFVRVDLSGRNVFVANYEGGSVAVFPIRGDGSLGAHSAFVQDVGTGPNPRQAVPRAHSLNVTFDNRFAVEAEFGSDKLAFFHFDAAKGTLRPADPPYLPLAPGSGPRHFTLHPNGRIAYCINELASTITVLGFDAAADRFQILQTVSTRPPGYTGPNTAAEMLVHPSGRFVYASNRGPDDIAAFAVDAKGSLSPLVHVPSGGKKPRGFSLDPSGRWLIAANQDSGRIVVFHIDQDTGIPAPTGVTFDVGSPACVKFLPQEAR